MVSLLIYFLTYLGGCVAGFKKLVTIYLSCRVLFLDKVASLDNIFLPFKKEIFVTIYVVKLGDAMVGNLCSNI